MVVMCCACSLYPSIYLGIECISSLLLVLVAGVGGGERGGGVMTFAVFAGDPCYRGERLLPLPYFSANPPLTTSSSSKSLPAADLITLSPFWYPPPPVRLLNILVQTVVHIVVAKFRTLATRRRLALPFLAVIALVVVVVGGGMQPRERRSQDCGGNGGGGAANPPAPAGRDWSRASP